MTTEQEITAHYIDKWFDHQITNKELEERLDKHPLSTYEETPIGVIQNNNEGT